MPITPSEYLLFGISDCTIRRKGVTCLAQRLQARRSYAATTKQAGPSVFPTRPAPSVYHTSLSMAAAAAPCILILTRRVGGAATRVRASDTRHTSFLGSHYVSDSRCQYSYYYSSDNDIDHHADTPPFP